MIHRLGFFTNTRKNRVLILGKLAEFINKMDQQKLRRELPRNIRSTLESEHPLAKQKCSIAFLVVDNPLVVELCRANSQPVISIGRYNNKPTCSQKSLHQLVFLRRELLHIQIVEDGSTNPCGVSGEFRLQ